MSKRMYLKWKSEELDWLRANYGKLPEKEMIEGLQGRKWEAIKKKAFVLGLKHEGFAKKKADLSILLHDNPVTYYWLGFLMADGGFTDRRIQLGVAEKDLSHLNRFLSFVGSTNKIQELEQDQYRVKLTNVAVVRQLRAKFHISSRKTYEPCDLTGLTNDLLFSLIVGFIDGDGCIHCTGVHTHRLCVVGHASWLSNFKLMQEFLHRRFAPENHKYRPAYLREVRVRLPGKKKKSKHTLAVFYIGKKGILRAIKQKADELGLPYMERKLGQI